MIGDLAAAMSHGKGEPTPVPGVSPGAKQMGRAAAANLLRRLRGEPTRPFRYIDYGNLATIGRKAAVVELAVPVLGALRFSGFSAWLFWLFAHIYFLIGFRNRLIVHGRLGLGLLHVRAQRPGGRRAATAPNRRRPQNARLLGIEAMDTRTSPARLQHRAHPRRARSQGCAAVLVPSSDPHLSEYLPERWQGRQWLRASPARWARWSSRSTRRRCSPTAATGCRPSASSPAAASSW